MAQAMTGSGSTTGEDVPPSAAITEAVSARADSPVSELPPLNGTIDPEALDTLFSGRETGGSVEFQYAGYLVTVHADHTVEVVEA
jgi:hypothetical protein